VGVALRENAAAVMAFARQFGVEFPLWIDAEGRSPAAFGVWGHPSTILIDARGTVVGRMRGERDWGTAAARGLLQALAETR
jgi:hypothetical protein